MLIGAAAFAAVFSAANAADSVANQYSESTENGHYLVTIMPVPEVPPIAELHNWIVHIETREGETFVPSRLGITGGMPTHGHGMVSEPRVTKSLGDGDYQIEGMKFHMGGEWQIIVGLSGPVGFDRAVFDISILTNTAGAAASSAGWSEGAVGLSFVSQEDEGSCRLAPSHQKQVPVVSVRFHQRHVRWVE